MIYRKSDYNRFFEIDIILYHIEVAAFQLKQINICRKITMHFISLFVVSPNVIILFETEWLKTMFTELNGIIWLWELSQLWQVEKFHFCSL